MIRPRAFAAALATLAATTAAPAAVVQTGQPVMGTVLEVTVIAPTQPRARELADQAIAEARRWDDILTTWRPEGELARLNAACRSTPRKPNRAATPPAAGGECRPPASTRVPVDVSADLYRALEKMVALGRATDGAFDPAIGPLVGLWRTHRNLAALPRPGGRFRIAHALRLENGRAELAPGAALDAGGIGKGIALDAMAAGLRSGGATAFFLDFGGSSQIAFGAPARDSNPANATAGARGWPVAIAALDPGKPHGILRLHTASLSTSRALPPGDEAGPIIDPRTGHPAPPPRLATVLGPSAAATDAWSTALVVLGRQGIDKARAAGLEVLYQDDTGTVMTEGFRQLLR